MQYLNKYLHGDRWIWTIVFLLTMVSLLAVYSSTSSLANRQQGGNVAFYLFKHSMMVGIGLVLMYVCHNIPYRKYAQFAKIMIWPTVALLLFTLVKGTNINDARRWVSIPGTGISFQSSDLAKLVLITYIARFLTLNQDNLKNFVKGFLPVIFFTAIIIGLISAANMSTALMMAATAILILLIGRINFKYITYTAVLLAIVLGGMLLLGPRSQTYISRVTSHFASEDKADINGKGYQAAHAKIAIASGIFPKGPGNSSERNFLPEPYSDFVFAIIIEEYSLIGGILVILMYLTFLYRCMRLITLTQNTFAVLLAGGLSISIAIQAFCNMMVATGILPVTGVTLPLISMGGTSILFTSVAVGIILSVSREVEEGRKQVRVI